MGFLGTFGVFGRFWVVLEFFGGVRRVFLGRFGKVFPGNKGNAAGSVSPLNAGRGEKVLKNGVLGFLGVFFGF